MSAIRCNMLKTKCQHVALCSFSTHLLPLSRLPEWARLRLNMGHWVSLIKTEDDDYFPSCLYRHQLSCLALTMFTDMKLQPQPPLIISHRWTINCDFKIEVDRGNLREKLLTLHRRHVASALGVLFVHSAKQTHVRTLRVVTTCSL